MNPAQSSHAGQASWLIPLLEAVAQGKQCRLAAGDALRRLRAMPDIEGPTAPSQPGAGDVAGLEMRLEKAIAFIRTAPLDTPPVKTAEAMKEISVVAIAAIARLRGTPGTSAAASAAPIPATAELGAAVALVRKALSHVTREYRPEDAAIDLLDRELRRLRALPFSALPDRALRNNLARLAQAVANDETPLDSCYSQDVVNFLNACAPAPAQRSSRKGETTCP